MDYAEDLRKRKEYAKEVLGSEEFKKTTVWEKDIQNDDFTKWEQHNADGSVEIVDISESMDEQLLMLCRRNYRWFFEKLRTDLENEPTVYDYHYLYTKLLEDLTSDLTEFIYFSTERNGDRTFKDVLYAHEKEELKLELVFIEYAEKLIISESNAINKIDALFKGRFIPKIIIDLIDAGQLYPTPIGGKYKPYKSMPQFIKWCFDNGYGEDITPEFVFSNIAYNGNSIASIKEYVRIARKTMNDEQ